MDLVKESGPRPPPRLASSSSTTFRSVAVITPWATWLWPPTTVMGHLYITGLAERRFRGTYLRCEAIDVDGSQATVRHRAIAEHLESGGVLLEF